LKVVRDRPQWLTNEESGKLKTYDIDTPSGWLARFLTSDDAN
jgi:hypothetical protein